jgi:hypothetical protein
VNEGDHGEMAKKKNHMPQNYQAWVEARRKYHLSHTHIQMARELGMNPKRFGSVANHQQAPWKVPLPEFIEHLYVKRCKKERPDQVRSLEEMVKAQQQKQEQRQQRIASP